MGSNCLAIKVQSSAVASLLQVRLGQESRARSRLLPPIVLLLRVTSINVKSHRRCHSILVLKVRAHLKLFRCFVGVLCCYIHGGLIVWLTQKDLLSDRGHLLHLFTGAIHLERHAVDFRVSR